MTDLASFQCIPIASINPVGLGATFVPLNGSGFDDDIKILKIYNGGTVGVDISFDGVTQHDYWPPGATIIIDFQTNHADNSAYGSGTLYGRKGQIIYGRDATNSTYVKMTGFR